MAVSTTVAYVLLILDLVIGAAIVWGIGGLLLWLLGRSRRQKPVVASTDESVPMSRRECGKCHRSWLAAPDAEISSFGLRLRRRSRRSQRRRGREPSAWSLQTAWDRCPSCLSTYVFRCDEQARRKRQEERAVRRARGS